MKKFQAQLKSIAKSLTALGKQVEKVSEQVEKLSAKPAPAKKAAPKKAAAKKAAPEKAVVKKTVTKKAAPKKAAGAKKPSVIDTVYGLVARSKKGVSIATLKEKTEFDSRQLSNALFKLTKRDKIETKSRGIYIKK